jgi:hypothetical protein
MANFFTDNEDLLYYVSRGLDWDPLVDATEHGYRTEGGFANRDEAVSYYRDVLEMVGEFVAEEIAPHSAEIDRQGVRLERGRVEVGARQAAIFEKIKGLELHSMCLPRELGGSNCPMLIYFIESELFARADVSVMAHHSFHCGTAMALLNYSLLEGSTTIDAARARITSTRFEEEIGEIARGEAWGSMDITEPSAGSDMAALRTRAEQDEAGVWRVTGEKAFITSGHGKYHIVIARTERADPAARTGEGRGADDPFAGLKGLSLFLVPSYVDDADGSRRWLASVDRVEEKLGHHGSVTASVVFDRTPAQLLGGRGEGFRQMLTLMNFARVGVGFESIGLCEAAYRLARDYAAERPSMGKPIDRHEMIAGYLDEMRTDLQGLRALAMAGAWESELAQKLVVRLQYMPPVDADERRELERRIARHRRKARRITPLLKYLAAEKAVEMARRCVQIHGGNGYTREYGAEKLLRDAVVMPIYEGTSQIQALMAMKDSLDDVMRDPGRFVRDLAQARWRAATSRDPAERRVAQLEAIALGARQHLIARTAADKLRWLQDQPVARWPRAFFKDWNPKRDFAWAMLHAEDLTRLLADVAVCGQLLDQARRDPERADVLERYLERAEPRARYLAEVIAGTGQRLLERLGGAARESRGSSSAAS